MTKRALNLYEMIFGGFFLLKITATGIVATWNWFFIFLPLIIGILHNFFIWIYEGTGMNRQVKNDLKDTYLDYVRKSATRKAIKDARKNK